MRLCSAWNTAVHCRQADVLVDATITRHEVIVEGRVVVAREHRLAVRVEHGVAVRVEARQQVAGDRVDDRSRAVCDVVEEGVTRADGVRRHRNTTGPGGHQRGDPGVIGDHELRVAVVAGNEVAVRVGGQQRDVEQVGVGELDAQDAAGLRLEVGPRRHSAGRASMR